MEQEDLMQSITNNIRKACGNVVEDTPIRNVFYAKWAGLLTLKGVKFNSIDNSNGEIFANCYCLNVVPSGGNKNVMFNYIENSLLPFEQEYIDRKNEKYKQMYISNQTNKMQSTRKKVDYDNLEQQLSNDFENEYKLIREVPDATPEALYDMSEVIEKLGQGAINIKNTEFVRYFTNSVNDKFSINKLFLDVLYDAYDGEYKARLIKGKQRKSKENICTNVMFTGAYGKLSDGKVKAEFKDRLLDGYARRFLYYFNPTLNYVLNPPEMIDVEEKLEAKNKLKELQEDLKARFECIPENFVYEISNDLISVNNEWYRTECLQMAKDLYKGCNRELDTNDKIFELYLSNMRWLVLKLSVIIHSLYMPNEKFVNLNCLLYAQDVVMDSYDNLQKLVLKQNDTIVDKFVSFFINNSSRDIYKVDLRNQGLLSNQSFKERFENLYPEIKVSLLKEGYSLSTFKGSGNSLIYRCEKIEGIIPYQMNISVAKLKKMEEVPTKFEFMQIDTNEFEKLIKQKTAFVAGELRDGKRKKENYIGNQNTIWLDFDDIKSMGAIQAIFEDYSYVAYTSKNHQKEKNGLVGDRFRLILFTKCELPIEIERYTRIMKNIIERYGSDNACSDCSRLYWSNPSAEVYMNKGKLFDWRPYDVDLDELYECKKTQIIRANIKGNTIADVLFTPEGDLRLGFDKVYVGNRNKGLFHCATFLRNLVLDGALEHNQAIVKIKDLINRTESKDFKEYEKRRMIEIVEKLIKTK